MNRLRLLLQTKRKQSGWLKLLKRTVIQYFISLVTVGALLQLRNNVLQSKLYVMSLKKKLAKPTLPLRMLMLPALGFMRWLNRKKLLSLITQGKVHLLARRNQFWLLLRLIHALH
ncbi:Uncharacterised protein [Klebsiella pneumoniae]|nr:Uncharacterised protein [Klebsiella pneumoniae]